MRTVMKNRYPSEVKYSNRSPVHRVERFSSNNKVSNDHGLKI